MADDIIQRGVTKPEQDGSRQVWRRAAVATAFISGIFSLVIVSVLVFYHLQRSPTGLPESEELSGLKEQLALHPEDESVKDDIRRADLSVRQEFFLRQNSMNLARYMLLASLLIFVAAIKAAGTLQEQPPKQRSAPQQVSEEQMNRVARLSVFALAGTLAIFAVVAATGWKNTLLPESSFTVATPPKPVPEPFTPPSADEIRMNWPRFRGPDGLGISAFAETPTSWNGATGEGILWKSPVPLKGVSSPIVWGNRIYTTGASSTERAVFCFDMNTGGLVWKGEVKNVPCTSTGPVKVWNDTCYAVSTPATDRRHVCAMFSNGDLACFDMDGKLLWARNLGIPDNEYGHASSLLIHRELLTVQFDEGAIENSKSRLLALRTSSGETVWETKRPVGMSWTSPIIITVKESQQLVTCAVPWVIAYDPANGTEIWRADCLNWGYHAVPSAIYTNGLVLTATDGAVLAAAKPDGRGDVSKTHVAWSLEGTWPAVCSPVSDGELVYLLTSEGRLSCYEAATGGKVWEKELPGEGRKFETSPSLASGKLWIMNDAGIMLIIKAGRAYEEVGRAQLGEACLGAGPAFLDGKIIIRGENNLFCVGKK